MDNYLIQYINQQLGERGYKKFHHEPYAALINDMDLDYRIRAYNEFFYLVSMDLAPGTTIRSDINIYIASQLYVLQKLHQIQEFNGLIIIQNPYPITQLLEFIRVIPE